MSTSTRRSHDDAESSTQHLETENRSGSRFYGGVILAGGRGTRLSLLTRDLIPKPLYRVFGRELIRYSIDNMDPSIVDTLVFALGHQAEQIKDWVQSTDLPARFKVKFADQPRDGVIEALQASITMIDGNRVIFCNSDEIRLNLNLAAALRFHQTSGSIATAVVAFADRLYNQAVLEIEEKTGLVLRLNSKDPRYLSKPEEMATVHTGFVILDKSAAEYFDSDLDKDWKGITVPLIEARRLHAYIDPKIVFFNANDPEEVSLAEAALKKKIRH